jgi:hypothetical protein
MHVDCKKFAILLCPLFAFGQICALVALNCTSRICGICYKQNFAEFVVQKINEVSLSCFAGFGPGQRLLAQAENLPQGNTKIRHQ